ncbi:MULTISPECIES: hypothetical protein [unclassified Streptomyces]|uniref:hypothetical protein n=1 Tax=unclassified Streptomyces TaxID=2593676 RepID=UPI002366CF58|nr:MULTISPECIES: hypothetical protein [unclassified Streptomyces]MDF3140669.1 hypothetical protein [Streptomyces sp. T21Q-yed]WDF38506.1 hypothetical protein PBV52_17745 [Streptomyces sp. T12]
MRSLSLPKPIVLAALGCLVLTACGTQGGGSDSSPAGNTVSTASPSGGASEVRFLKLMNRIAQQCTPDAPSDEGDGSAPRPEDLPGAEGITAPPAYGPGETPPGTPNGEGEIPVPVEDGQSTPAPDAPAPAEVKEVPLSGVEKCSGDEHIKRISEKFTGTDVTSHTAMRRTLIGLGYPATRIHRMPDHAGAPRARLDLRALGSHLALEVTGTGTGVIAEAFGAPDDEGVNVLDVERKPNLDAPTS